MIVQSIVGLIAFALIAWLASENRRRVSVRMVLTGLILQVGLGAVLLKLSAVRDVFLALNGVIVALEESTRAGTAVVFGYLTGVDLPFEERGPNSSFILAFRGLPLVLLMSALSSLLFYWRVLPYVVRAFSWLLQRSMRIGGAEGLGVSANIFVGMVEAPLLIRPYLVHLSRSELFSVMTCGMATIAGTVMVLYATILTGVLPGAAGHILTASIISAPASILVARLMVPETGAPTSGGLDPGTRPASAMDAITRGTLDGVALVINITAMLVVLVALVHLANQLIGLLPAVDGAPLTVQRLAGWLLGPVAWLMGLPWEEAVTGGALLGTKTILNELIAYLDLAALPPDALSDRSRLIMTYALCGFANFGSLGIMIGGVATMVPSRRSEVVGLGLRSIVAGTLSTCMTGAVVGLL